MTPDLASLGFKPMPRDDFRSLIQWYIDEPGHVGRWEVDPTLDLADWPAKPSDTAATHVPAPLKVA